MATLLIIPIASSFKKENSSSREKKRLVIVNFKLAVTWPN